MNFKNNFKFNNSQFQKRFRVFDHFPGEISKNFEDLFIYNFLEDSQNSATVGKKVLAGRPYSEYISNLVKASLLHFLFIS